MTGGTALIGLLVSLVIGGCQGPPPQISIEKAHIRFSKTMKNEANVFLKIVNAGGEDRLLGTQVSLPGASTEIQQVQGGIMTMIIVKELPIPAHQTTELKQWDSYIVIKGLPPDIGNGYRLSLTLDFEKSGKIVVPLTFTMTRPHPAKQTVP